MIWNDEISLDKLNSLPEGLATLLDIKFTDIGPNTLTATMPVNKRTIQPRGIVHGGANCVLAETVGSVASACLINPDTHMAVGLEINANHLRPVSSGMLTALCTAVHTGRRTHVWDIRISDTDGRLSCISRLTVAIVEIPKKA